MIILEFFQYWFGHVATIFILCGILGIFIYIIDLYDDYKLYSRKKNKTKNWFNYLFCDTISRSKLGRILYLILMFFLIIAGMSINSVIDIENKNEKIKQERKIVLEKAINHFENNSRKQNKCIIELMSIDSNASVKYNKCKKCKCNKF